MLGCVMSKIAVISANKNYMVVTLCTKLEELGQEAISIDPHPNSVSKLDADTAVVVLYDESDLSEDKVALTYIKDWSVEKNTPVFVIGNPAEISVISSYFPKHIYQGEFARPLNIKDVATVLDAFVRDESSSNKKKILVVDDSGAYLRNVKAWLDGKYQVIPANSGMMAIKYISSNKPDLVLLDYEMPVCDGKQVLQMIRSDSECADLPVIFLTSKDDKESVLQVMSLKPAGYLLKTMAPEDIIKNVDAFFERQKAGV